jgi:iron complex outermembrane receptor protein
MRFMDLRFTLVAACVLALAGPGHAADTDADLADLSLDQLMGLTVTSASKKEQNANEVPSAIFVLTQEDIRRSGATTIPEVLRLVPGLQVARNTSNGWSVTARGFNGRFASKLLVLIDGRSVYTPLFSGVYWDVQDTVLEDIDRIEVIRGPGATVWGANAVNGVINIITKSSKDTEGLLASGGGGNEERGFGTLRWGGAAGESLHYRGYAKYFNRDGQEDSNGAATNDDWDIVRTGFRMDWDATNDDLVTLQGDFYDGDAGMDLMALPGPGTPFQADFDEHQQLRGWNVVSRWSHTFSEEMDASLQFYYDRTDRTNPLVDEVRDTFDLDFQHRFSLPFNQELIWGAGYRVTSDDTHGTYGGALVPDHRTDDTISLFVQDEVRFWEDKARLTFGTKVENNDYTGWEYQPSVRLALLPAEHHTFWAAVSRAVRVPSRVDDNVVLNVAYAPAVPMGFPNPLDPSVICPGPLGCPATTIQVLGTGTRTSKSERVYAFEAGWRAELLDRLTLDVAAFYNDYNSLESFTIAPLQITSLAPFEAYQAVYLSNRDSTETWGTEVDLRADLMEWWRVIVAYTYYHGQDSTDATHTGVIRSQLDLPFDLEFDATLYLVGNTFTHADQGGFGIADLGPIPGYERLDLRLGWNPCENFELSLVGLNLTDNRHPEAPSELGIATTEVQRSFYGKVTFRY